MTKSDSNVAEVPRQNWFTGENSAVMWFLLIAAALLVLGVTAGLILALEFVFPDLFAGVGFLVFGRLRQAHTNTVMFAFLSTGMMGTWYYIVPQLTGRKLWNEGLGTAAAILWGVTVLAGVILLFAGQSQGREYAEMLWIIDVGVIVVLIMNLVNLFMTISKRVERKMYVSLWYISGTLIWFPLLYFIGNVMWNVPSGALTGIDDAIFNWFYGHNVLGLWFTTGFLAVIYYIVPRETHTPLYSLVLSLFAFWGIALFYTGVGGHHLEWAPIPYWLKTIAVAESIGMIIVIVAFMSNIWLTMRGSWNKIFTSIPLRFVVVGWAAYILVSYQGSHLALRSINLLFHFTQYVPGHSHLSLLFFAASTLIGGHLLHRPARAQRPVVQHYPGERWVHPIRNRVHLLLWRLPAGWGCTRRIVGTRGSAGLDGAARAEAVYGSASGRRRGVVDQLHHLCL